MNSGIDLQATKLFLVTFTFRKGTILRPTKHLLLKVKVKYLRGAYWQSRSLQWQDFPCPSEPGFVIMPLGSALSVTYPLCGSALTDATDNPSEMCPLKLTDFCLFLYHWSYTILQGPLIPPMAFTSCHDRGSNRLPPDGRASTLTTQPLRLASKHWASWWLYAHTKIGIEAA